MMNNLNDLDFDEKDFERKLLESLENHEQQPTEDANSLKLMKHAFTVINYNYELNKFIVFNELGAGIVLDPVFVKAFKGLSPEVLASATFSKKFTSVVIEIADVHVNFKNWVVKSLQNSAMVALGIDQDLFLLPVTAQIVTEDEFEIDSPDNNVVD